jgi:hypothetical protein
MQFQARCDELDKDKVELALPMAEARGFSLQSRLLPDAGVLHRVHERFSSPRAPRRGVSFKLERIDPASLVFARPLILRSWRQITDSDERFQVLVLTIYPRSPDIPVPQGRGFTAIPVRY